MQPAGTTHERSEAKPYTKTVMLHPDSPIAIGAGLTVNQGYNSLKGRTDIKGLPDL